MVTAPTLDEITGHTVMSKLRALCKRFISFGNEVATEVNEISAKVDENVGVYRFVDEASWANYIDENMKALTDIRLIYNNNNRPTFIDVPKGFVIPQTFTVTDSISISANNKTYYQNVFVIKDINRNSTYIDVYKIILGFVENDETVYPVIQDEISIYKAQSEYDPTINNIIYLYAKE